MNEAEALEAIYHNVGDVLSPSLTTRLFRMLAPQTRYASDLTVDTIVENGIVVGITITNQGSGYTP